MIRRSNVIILGVSFVCALLALSPVEAAPYWVKPGAMLEYRAVSYHPVGGGFMFNDSGVLVSVSGPNVTVVFRVVSVNGGLAKVNVSITATGSEKFPVIVVYPGSNVKPFWSKSEVLNVTKLPDNLTKLYLLSVTVGGQYLVNLTTGWVYGENGKPYGHTVLWDDLKPNETFAFYGGKTVKVLRVKVLNATVRTYYSTFPKPNVWIIGSHVATPTGFSYLSLFYSPEYDVCLSFIMDPIPDFNAVGVYGFMWTDDAVSAANERLLKEHHGRVTNGIWAPGVILAEATLGSPKGSRPSPPVSSDLRYLVPLSLAVFLAVTFARRRYNG